MGVLSKKLRSVDHGGQPAISFWCPGCQEMHMICVEPRTRPGPIWSYDGNAEAPTFSPSVLITSGHYVSSHKPGDSCWCTYNATAKRKAPFNCFRCHSFVRDGRIQFLGDCTHGLAGQTVDLPDLPNT